MTAEIISGKDVAQAIRAELATEVAALREQHGIVPGLCTVLVGEDPGSVSYVTAKGKACQELGMKSLHHDLPAETTEQDLLDLVDQLNRDDAVHGILVQLPLPKHINESQVLYAIDPEQGRRRVPPGERRPAGDRRGAFSALHPGGHPAS